MGCSLRKALSARSSAPYDSSALMPAVLLRRASPWSFDGASGTGGGVGARPGARAFDAVLAVAAGGSAKALTGSAGATPPGIDGEPDVAPAAGRARRCAGRRACACCRPSGCMSSSFTTPEARAVPRMGPCAGAGGAANSGSVGESTGVASEGDASATRRRSTRVTMASC
jgi:hypothetical protein